MSGGPGARLLADGRLHLGHGPIDLIVEAFAERPRIEAAYDRAVTCFRGLLGELVGELEVLRRPLNGAHPLVRGPVARRMVEAVIVHRDVYVTPMAAVAGAVADQVLAAMVEGGELERAYVNNGGDIAFYLADGARFDVGLVARIEDAHIDAAATIDADSPVRGIATSGWRGRSLSLGIADSVSVLAADAATADAAATLIANAVDVDHPAIERQPASVLDADSDLGRLPVTVAVGPLSRDDIVSALEAGTAEAGEMWRRGLIEAAFLSLAGHHRTLGAPLSALPAYVAAYPGE